MSSYLVTGGSGFIGSHLVELLLNDDHDVSIWDTGDPVKFNKDDRASLAQIDVVRAAEMGMQFSQDFKYDAIFHLAGQSRVQPSMDDPSDCIRQNVLATAKMLDFAKALGIPFIFISSGTVHDASRSPYAMTKKMGEAVCLYYRKTFKMKVSIARLYNVYGPRQHETGDRVTLIGAAAHALRTGTPLPITGSGNQERDFIHVGDVCDALVAIAYKGVWNHEFEIGTGIGRSVRCVARMFGCEIQVIPKRKGESWQTVAGDRVEKTKKLLDWEPEVCLKEYIKTVKGELDATD
jgi:UDP-glucose 4-epimerase